MQPYANSSGNSGVNSFEAGSNYIRVGFDNGRIYEYTYASAGPRHIETMKTYALAGRGLCGFIQRYVKYKYSRRIR